MNTIGWLVDRMATFGDRDAMIWRDRRTTFEQLRNAIEEYVERLRGASLDAGGIVALEGDYSPQACALLLALAQLRMVVVPLASATAAERLAFQRIAEVQFAVNLPECAVVTRARSAEPANAVMQEFLTRGHPGLVLFSSGSTGEPKAILHDLGHLIEKFQRPRPALRTLAFLLLDHIGGLNTLFHTLANGGTVVVVDARDPGTVCAAIERHRVELLPTSPTFLNLLLASGEHERFDLSSLKLVTYGTEVMPESTLARLRVALPHVELRQTYGLSEVGILRAKSLASDSIWVKIGGEGFETKIVDGTLRIRARTSMVGYLNYPSPFDDDRWFDTGDLVEVNGEYVRFLGRQSSTINVGGQKVHPAEVENVLLEMPEIRDAVVYGEKNPLTGQVVAARVNLAAEVPGPEIRRRIRTYCGARLAPFKVPSRIVVVEERLHNVRFKKVAAHDDGREKPTSSDADAHGSASA
jgi:acyl-coenzyme A synthetase/AMP-(fatty) acid ligase